MSNQTQQIEGLPVGTRIARIGAPKEGEYFAGCDGKVIKCRLKFNEAVAILAPDNTYGVVDLASLPIPDGYETIWLPSQISLSFRVPDTKNEYWLGRDLGVHGVGVCDLKCDYAGDDPRRIILRRKKTVKRQLVVVMRMEGTHHVVTSLPKSILFEYADNQFVRVGPDCARIEEVEE